MLMPFGLLSNRIQAYEAFVKFGQHRLKYFTTPANKLRCFAFFGALNFCMASSLF